MPNTKLYIVVYAALVAATIAEVVIRLVSSEIVAIVMLLILIASAKAVTISLYYQHLRYESWRIAVMPIAALVGIATLAISAGYSIAMGG
jgi:hypothetical protein